MSDFYQNNSMSTNFIGVPNRKFEESPSGGSPGRTHDLQSLSQVVSGDPRLEVVAHVAVVSWNKL
jgi:hypothetical protein